MIEGIAGERAAALFEVYSFGGLSTQIRLRARAKSIAIDAAGRLKDARVPPGNRLEALLGERLGQRSVRANEQ